MLIAIPRPRPKQKKPEEKKAFAAVEHVKQHLLKLVDEKHASAETRWLAQKVANGLETVGKMDSPVLGAQQVVTFCQWLPEIAPTWDAANTMLGPVEMKQVQDDNSSHCKHLSARFEEGLITHRFQDRDFQLSMCHIINGLNEDWRISQSNTSPRQLLLLAGQDGLPDEEEADEGDDTDESDAELDELDPEHRKRKRRKMRRKGLKLKNIRYCSKKSPANLAKRPVGHPKTQRGEEGAGSYAVLEAFACIEGLTPAALAEICWAVVTFSSLEEARKYLQKQNQDLSIDTLERVYSNVAKDCIVIRQQWAESGQLPPGLGFEQQGGRALGTFSDGFYLQMRKAKMGPIPEGYTEHPWWMKWTESKSFVITELDSEGHPAGLNIKDGTLGTADDMFCLLCMYLFESGLDLSQYDYIVLGSDGADWLRKRMARLVELLVQAGVPREKIKQLVDWSHTYRKLWSIAGMRTGWTGKEADKWQQDFEREHNTGPDRMRKPWEPRSKKGEHSKNKTKLSKTQKAKKKWVETVAEYLWIGDVDTVLAMIDELRVGRKAKDFKSARGFFVKNRERMCYSELRALGLPVGTGVMESAGRQTIGMRMAAAGTSWHPENAEGMIMMVSYLKSGNWDVLITMVLNFRARRFDPDHPSCRTPINKIRKRVRIVVPIRPKEKKRNSGIHDAWKARGQWVRQGGPRGNFFSVQPPAGEAAA